MTGEIVGKIWVQDRRIASAYVSNVDWLYTPSGNYPIEPRLLEVRYNRSSAPEVYIILKGPPVGSHPKAKRPGHRYISRKVSYDSAPEWVRQFIENHRPDVVLWGNRIEGAA